MTEKLTLHSTVALALSSGWPLEVVQGATQKSRRAHLLVNHPDFPEFHIVFGDEAHGFLMDSAWTTLVGGQKIRVREEDVRKHLSTPAPLQRWTREVPLADGPLHLYFMVKNTDLAEVSYKGRVKSVTPEGVEVDELLLNGNTATLTLMLAEPAEVEVGAFVAFAGTYHYPFTVTEAKFI